MSSSSSPPRPSAGHPTRRAAAVAALLATLSAQLLLSACSGGGSVPVDPPRTTGRAAAQCAALAKALPAALQGLATRATTPPSTGTAAWGDPAVTLRCGVSRPGVLDPASPEYDPEYQKHDVEEIQGVCWVSEQTADRGFRFTTVKQQTYVELNVPAAYAGRQSPLSALAGPVLGTDPVDSAHPFDCL